MSIDKKPDTTTINDYIRNALNPAQKFTVVQDGRSREFTTTTSDGQVFEGRDGMNDALHYFFSGAKPRNRRDDNEGGGTA